MSIAAAQRGSTAALKPVAAPHSLEAPKPTPVSTSGRLYISDDDPQVRSHGRMPTVRAVKVGLLALGLLLAALAFFRKVERSEFQKVFTAAAARMQQGDRIHFRVKDAYAYPPFMALAATPLVGLPNISSLSIWFTVCMAAAAWALGSAWRLAESAETQSSDTHPDGTRNARTTAGNVAFVIGLLLIGRFLLATFENQQVDLVAASFVFAGCWQLACRRGRTAGLFLGVAAAMKCTPLLFVPYLLWRRHIVGAALLFATAVGLNLLPDVIHPRSDGSSYLVEWSETFLLPAAENAPGSWHNDPLLNQSLGGTLRRYVDPACVARHKEAERKMRRASHAETPPPADNANFLSASGALLLKVFTYGAAAMLLLVSAVWMIRRRAISATVENGDKQRSSGRTSDSASGNNPDRAVALECATLVCLMLLLSPMSGKAHFCILLLPAFLVARAAVAHWTNRGERERAGAHRAASVALLALLFLLGPLTAKGFVSQGLGNLALFAGLPMWFALVLWCAMIASSLRREAGAT